LRASLFFLIWPLAMALLLRGANAPLGGLHNGSAATLPISGDDVRELTDFSAVSALPFGPPTAQVVEMIVADDGPAPFVLDPFQLETRLVGQLTRIADSIVDRREFQEVVFPFPWSDEQQEDEPNGLHRFPLPNLSRGENVM
jgi:hypothetical protein